MRSLPFKPKKKKNLDKLSYMMIWFYRFIKNLAFVYSTISFIQFKIFTIIYFNFHILF